MRNPTGSTQRDTVFSARENIVHYPGVVRRRYRSMGRGNVEDARMTMTGSGRGERQSGRRNRKNDGR